MTSVSVSFEARRLLNSLKSMEGHQSVDALIKDMVKQHQLRRLQNHITDLRDQISSLKGMDIDNLVRRLKE